MVLGGIKQKNREDTNVIMSDTEAILAMCKRLVPSLKVITSNNKTAVSKKKKEKRKKKSIEAS